MTEGHRVDRDRVLERVLDEDVDRHVRNNSRRCAGVLDDHFVGEDAGETFDTGSKLPFSSNAVLPSPTTTEVRLVQADEHQASGKRCRNVVADRDDVTADLAEAEITESVTKSATFALNPRATKAIVFAAIALSNVYVRSATPISVAASTDVVAFVYWIVTSSALMPGRRYLGEAAAVSSKSRLPLPSPGRSRRSPGGRRPRQRPGTQRRR